MNQTITSSDGLLIGAGDKVARLDKAGPVGLLIGIVCTAILGVLYFTGDHAVIAGSWMVGWYFWLSITLGMFGLAILAHAIRPTWAISLLRLYEAGGGPASLLLMAVLFLPIVAHPGNIYSWADPVVARGDLGIQHKAALLNVGDWTIRYVIWFAIWIVFAWYLRNSTHRQEITKDPRLEMGRSSWGGFGIVLYMLTVSFALIDWAMSIQPHFTSTMYSLWQIVAFALGGMSLCVVIACLNAKREPYTEIVSPNLTKDWGNILFMLTMLWAYTAVSQYLIIWNGNIPETASYYSTRSFLGWGAIGMVTIVGQFLIPWMTLLSPRVKRYPKELQKIAGFILVVHFVDTYLAIAPILPTAGEHFSGGRRAAGQYIWFDLLALLAIGGFWVYVFARQVKKAPLLVSYDQRLQEALVNAH